MVQCLQCTGNAYTAADNLPHSVCSVCAVGTMVNDARNACVVVVSNSSNFSVSLKGASSSSSHSSSSSSSSHSSSSSSSSHSSSKLAHAQVSSSSSSHSSSSSSSSSSVFQCPVGGVPECTVLDPVYGQHTYSSVLLGRPGDFGRGRLMDGSAWAPAGIGAAHYVILLIFICKFVICVNL